jgi:hypothetical protein
MKNLFLFQALSFNNKKKKFFLSPPPPLLQVLDHSSDKLLQGFGTRFLYSTIYFKQRAQNAGEQEKEITISSNKSFIFIVHFMNNASITF